MTPQEAREILQQIRKQKCVSECDYGCKLYELETFCLEEKALDTAIKALEQTSHLKGRPCEVCEFHSDNGCSKWKCIFEEGTK